MPNLIIQVSSAGGDDVVDRRATALSAELLDFGIEARPARDETTTTGDGYRTDPLTIGALVLAFSASGGVFTEMIGLLRDWLNRTRSNELTLIAGDRQIKITGTPTREEKALVDDFKQKVLQ